MASDMTEQPIRLEAEQGSHLEAFRVAYTNLQETPPDIADIYEEARSKKADVVKLTTLARTPEEAWPLVKLLVRSASGAKQVVHDHRGQLVADGMGGDRGQPSTSA